MKRRIFIQSGGLVAAALASPAILAQNLPSGPIRIVVGFPPGSGPDFVNACCLVGTGLPPDALLSRLHGIEAALGRERIVRWGARTVDLDLLAVGDLVLPDRATQDRWRDLPPDRQTREAPDTLILPHPRLQDRGFVLIPLADILPSWRHPVTGLTVSAMRDALSPGEKAGIWPL